jgi:hypothetical protein
VGCGSDSSDKDDTGTSGTSTTEEVDEESGGGILPKAGEWPVLTTGWTTDDCNAEDNLTGPTSILFADVDETSFMTTYFDEYGQLGNTTVCTHDADDLYNCSEFINGFTYTDIDATVSLTGTGTVTMTSEDSASGQGNFVMDCTGADCAFVARATNSGSLPCVTTFNWTAQAN